MCEGIWSDKPVTQLASELEQSWVARLQTVSSGRLGIKWEEAVVAKLWSHSHPEQDQDEENTATIIGIFASVRVWVWEW